MTPLITSLRELYKHRLRLAVINGTIAVLAAVSLFVFVDNYYDSTVVILPDYGGSSLMGGFSSLAAVAGLNIGESNPTAIYQKLLLSEAVLEKVVYAKYQTRRFDHPVNLVEYYEITLDKTGPGDPPALQERDKFLQLYDKLKRDGVTTELDRITNILTITVRTPEQQLSSDVANRLIAALDDYVRTKRRSNASDQRAYVQERVGQVSDSLATVENELKSFRENNRIVSSPQLLLEQSRLLRTVEILQTVFIELTKQLELIKLEEIKNSPIINVQEAAGVPVKKAGPSRAKYLLMILLVSLSATGGWVLFGRQVGEQWRDLRHAVKN